MNDAFTKHLLKRDTNAALPLYLYDFIYLWQLIFSNPNEGFIVRRTLKSHLKDNKFSSDAYTYLFSFLCLYICPSTLYRPIQSHVEDMKSSWTE